jgi:hypothetical protein
VLEKAILIMTVTMTMTMAVKMARETRKTVKRLRRNNKFHHLGRSEVRILLVKVNSELATSL